MFGRLKNLLLGYSFAPKINYSVYYALKQTSKLRAPVLSRILRYLAYHLSYFRNKFYEVIVNERIVEVPLVLQSVVGHKTDILDVGCNESLLTLHLASLGHKVTALDLNGYEFSHPNLQVIKGDICTIDLKEARYDFVIFLSVIEHIGLGAYGEKGFIDGDKKALEQAKRFLKPGGKIVLTMPYGKRGVTPTQRVYDAEQIRNLFRGFRIEVERYFLGLGQKSWQEVSQAVLSEVVSVDFTQGMAYFVLSSS